MDFYTQLAISTVDLLNQLGFPVVIQEKDSQEDDFGGESEAWNDVLSIKAAWDIASGSEGYAHGRDESNAQHKMIIAYNDLLRDTADASRMRVNYKGIHYNIKSSHVIGDCVAIQLKIERNSGEY